MLSKKRQKAKQAAATPPSRPKKASSSSQPAESATPPSLDSPASNAAPPSPPRGALNLLLSRARGAFHRSSNSSSGDVLIDEGAQPFSSHDRAHSTSALPFPTVEAPASSGGRFWQRSSERENVHSSPTKPGWLNGWGYYGKGKDTGNRLGRRTLFAPPLVSPGCIMGPIVAGPELTLQQPRPFSRSVDDLAPPPHTQLPAGSGRSASSEEPRRPLDKKDKKALLASLDVDGISSSGSWVNIAGHADKRLPRVRSRVYGVPLTGLVEADGTTVPTIVERCLRAVEERGRRCRYDISLPLKLTVRVPRLERGGHLPNLGYQEHH
jgi:hypothetical protein